ncbi:MAG: excinuclease ABC subunit UvrC [Clostridia bacterium]|nr:excinuclease ABC subunit UvrC [Clostridia bacterium]
MDIKEKLNKLPLSPGVYIMKDVFGNVIYIGKAKRLKSRVSQYFLNKNHSDKTKSMISQVADFDYILTNSELDAFVLECNLIKKHLPFYNILLKDGKSYPYIKIDTSQDFPKLEIVRKIKKDNAKYFGPFFGINVSDVVRAVNYAYPIRTCDKKIKDDHKMRRGCLDYSLGLCSAPCMCKITKEDYNNLLPDVYDFLNGKDNAVYDIICKKMEKAVEIQNFELAIKLRDLKYMLLKLRVKTVTALASFENIDVFGFEKSDMFYVFTVLIIRQGKMMGAKSYSFDNALIDDEQMLISFLTQYYLINTLIPNKILLPIEVDFEDALFKSLSEKLGKKLEVISPKTGVNKKLVLQANANAKEYLEKNCELETKRKRKKISVLNGIKEKLNLKNLPLRIEGYDISNISGTSSVCSIVVFVNGVKEGKHYRKFKIKEVVGPNDFESLRESITRRLEKLSSKDISFSSKPDLILIDGGKGQINACREVIKSFDKDIDVISLAKKQEEIFVEEDPLSKKLSKDDDELKLLQKVRDEAHRFAITFHKKLRKKKQVISLLDEIDGLGKVKKENLIERFKSVRRMKKASVDDLISVSGITPKLANEIIKKLEELN